MHMFWYSDPYTALSHICMNSQARINPILTIIMNSDLLFQINPTNLQQDNRNTLDIYV